MKGEREETNHSIDDSAYSRNDSASMNESAPSSATLATASFLSTTPNTPHPTPFLVDSHAHIDGEEFDADRDEMIARAREVGVRAILNVGTGDPQSGTLERAVEVAARYANVYAAVGVHPHDAKLFDTSAAQRLFHLLRSSARVIALGEIGLDYHYDHSPREVQREVFAQQLRMAREQSTERVFPLAVCV